MRAWSTLRQFRHWGFWTVTTQMPAEHAAAGVSRGENLHHCRHVIIRRKKSLHSTRKRMTKLLDPLVWLGRRHSGMRCRKSYLINDKKYETQFLLSTILIAFLFQQALIQIGVALFAITVTRSRPLPAFPWGWILQRGPACHHSWRYPTLPDLELSAVVYGCYYGESVSSSSLLGPIFQFESIVPCFTVTSHHPYLDGVLPLISQARQASSMGNQPTQKLVLTLSDPGRYSTLLWLTEPQCHFLLPSYKQIVMSTSRPVTYIVRCNCICITSSNYNPASRSRVYRTFEHLAKCQAQNLIIRANCQMSPRSLAAKMATRPIMMCWCVI